MSQDQQVETLIIVGVVTGILFLVVSAIFGKKAKGLGGRIAKVFVEIQRKSFHMISGSLLCAAYHWGMKYGYLFQANLNGGPRPTNAPAGSIDAAALYLGITFLIWLIELLRLQVPPVRRWYLNTFQGLLREKELNKAGGHAYFLAGTLAAMLGAPPVIAIMGVMMLSIGDAGASVGTAFGWIPVGSSPRRVEGSILCFAICTWIASYLGLEMDIAMIVSAIVTVGEVMAEVIGVDDNLVLPMFCVMGHRLATKGSADLSRLGIALGVAFVFGIALAAVVSMSAAPHSQAVADEAAKSKKK